MHLRPELRQLPFVICDSVTQGIISYVSEIAARHNISPGMKLFVALSVLPGIVPIVADQSRYLSFRMTFESILSKYDREVSFSGLTSASLNVTSFCDENSADPVDIAREVMAESEFPLRIGIGGSRIASKLAATREDGISIVPPAKFEFLRFIGSLPITAIPGLSAGKIEKLQKLGIGLVGQIIQNRGLVSFRFSQPFVFWLFSAALGIDHFFTVRPISFKLDFPPTADFVEISGRLRVLCQKIAVRVEQSGVPVKFMKMSFVGEDGKLLTKWTTFPYSSMDFYDIYAAVDSIVKDKFEMSHCGLTHVKVSVSERPFSQHRTQQTLGKWVGQIAEQPKIIKVKKTVLEDFFATTSASQEIRSLPAPKKKFRPRRPLSTRSHLTQRTLI
jgi:hypothetical protein